MVINNFIRFAEILKLKEEKRVVSMTIRPLITDCTGEIYYTDLQIQEGDKLTGYSPHTSTMLRNSPNPPRYHNGVVRTGDTIIIFNLGKTAYTGVAEPRFRRVVSHPSGKSEPALRAMSQGRCECVSLKLS